MTATSPSASSLAAAEFALFCNPESRRTEGFSLALGAALRQRPVLIPWQWVLEGGSWAERLPVAPKFLRLESPGRNWPVEQQLLLRGADIADEEGGRNWRRFSKEEVMALPNVPGRINPMRQWFLGWRRVLRELSDWASQAGLAARWLCPPEEVACMFDKAACQTIFEQAGIATPPALGMPTDFDELWELMRSSGRRRIFLKPCHGSSASGVIALESSRHELQAFSTLELETTARGLQLYNRRRIRVWRGAGEVRRLVDAACRERCLAQVWIPKAGFQGQPFDLRVVVIGGQARHVMLRLGRGPMTNSQLLGGKGDVDRLRQRMGSSAWAQMLELCERAMKAGFPRCLYAGFDVLVEPNFRSAWILEVNAFGDLLPRILHEDHDTYYWEIIQAMARVIPA